MKNWFSRLYPVFVLILALSLGIASLVGSKDRVSFYEQRTLAVAPLPTWGSLWDGSYLTQWETALGDRLPGREKLLKTYTRLNLALGRPVVNETVVTPQVLLPFQDYHHWDLGYLNEQAKESGAQFDALNQAVQSYGGYFLLMGIPPQSWYHREDYPAYMDDRAWHLQGIRKAFSQELTRRSIPFLDMREAYQRMGTPPDYYYLSDHHYTLAGAYAAYHTLLEQVRADTGWPVPAVNREDLVWETLPNPFLGSYGRKLYGLWEAGETIQVASPKVLIPFTRTDNGTPVEAKVLHLPETPEELVTYSTYMGGDVGETVIQTNRPSLKTALIFGDSFTNALETFLWMSFDETRCLDLRHYDTMSCLDYVKKYQPDLVLCVRDESTYLLPEGNGKVKP